MVMNPLNRRLKRMVQSNKGSFIALSAVVMLGVRVYTSMTTAYYNLSRSQADFYLKTRFADYYFQVVKAPVTVANHLQSLPGMPLVVYPATYLTAALGTCGFVLMGYCWFYRGLKISTW